ncbi:MAG TPA: pyruvate:ferredoxin (flavodoxin) oxidoreductase [Lentisphaerae bacterium]|nr:pyruvate:ferredoxin (flavodoxin) oxidoreductase [Lentisphaerota bacterium]
MKKAKGTWVVIDGNEAAAHIAHKLSEVCAIYPITPSSPMGEHADEWSAQGRTNIWGTIPHVVELQSEGGASGSVHGAAQAGALTSTFTASQGLLLMIPNMYKIAGELTPTVFHVSARTVATHALSIFGDHSDVMATRQTGFALLASSSVQEAMDMALVAHAATLESRIPFLHFFDGFRTSHEVSKIQLIEDEQIRAVINDDFVLQHRQRALNPERPVLRGTAQNPDVFFQNRETVNPYYQRVPEIVENVMNRLAEVTGRKYSLFDYHGAPDAERIMILMGSGAEAAIETVEYLCAQGEKVGVIKVHLYRPFSMRHLMAAIPPSTKSIAVLDRTKEPGSEGEPLYKDVVAAFDQAASEGTMVTGQKPLIVGGRYGLSSKEFTPAMVKAVLDELKKSRPKNHFTIGINDDVSGSSLDFDPSFSVEPETVHRAMFFGLGADGTVGANKNSIKIIGEETDNYAQGYFVYDSKKAGARTVSHLRFGPDPIRSTYLIQSANFVACHQFVFVEQIDMLKYAQEGGIFLLNSPFGPDEVWDKLPRQVQEQIIQKKLRFYVIDGYRVAREAGMGNRINTVMQTCFFAISGILPKDEAIRKIKAAIEKTYGRKGRDVVEKNFAAVDAALSHLHEVKVPERATSEIEMRPPVPPEAPQFVQKVTAEIIRGNGDNLPVSVFPSDGTWPTGTTRWEKRNIALTIPEWDPEICTQCGMCSFVCPHACIRAKFYPEQALADAPSGFKSAPLKGKDVAPGTRFTIQVSPEDCTGCGLCVELCPAKDKKREGHKALDMVDKIPILEREKACWEFFKRKLPQPDRTKLDLSTVKGVQFAEPLFEFSGACAGCGETPYLRLMSQLFGDRAMIANATGCSSIYGGNLPTTPWTVNREGRGPTWSNSLFEDNAEFGFGFRLTTDKHREFAEELLRKLAPQVGEDLAEALIQSAQDSEAEIAAQRARVAELKDRLTKVNAPEAKLLAGVADALIRRSIWLVGGDGWAYDIGYGGLDHVLASGRNVNALVLDTEVYSNTGGQMSKATPRGAIAKFAAAGKPLAKKDLGMMAMCYGTVYVARIAMGANPRHTIRAFLEAESYPGPSLIIAYCQCIAHGINMIKGVEQQKLAVKSGYWPLYRYDPRLAEQGKNPFQLDSKPPSIPFRDYALNEIRYRSLMQSDPERAERLLDLAQKDVEERWRMYQRWAGE